MSYILDALRRSQAERERGQVPGLGAQLSPPVSTESSPRSRPMLWVAVGAAFILLVAVVALWMQLQAQPGAGCRAGHTDARPDSPGRFDGHARFHRAASH